MESVRKATLGDVPGIHRLINHFARQELMLSRSRGDLYENLRDFTVAVDGERIVACGALHIVWEDLAEIKCLAVAEDHQKQGLGKAIVRSLVEEARGLEVAGVFCLTYQRPFFIGLGFQPASKESLPHKIWSECTRCAKFPDCDEEAAIMDLKRSRESA